MTDPSSQSSLPSSGERNSEKRIVRAELIIATLALIASACASVAAIVQTREAAVQTRATLDQTQIIAKQLGASIWPYLTIDEAFSPKKVSLTVSNQGLGPALVRTFTIFIDDRSQTRLHDVFNLVDPNKRGRSIDQSDLGGGSVIRPSQVFTIFSVTDGRLNRSAAETNLSRVRLELCYCSLLAECWSVGSRQSAPQAVHACGRSTPAISV